MDQVKEIQQKLYNSNQRFFFNFRKFRRRICEYKDRSK